MPIKRKIKNLLSKFRPLNFMRQNGYRLDVWDSSLINCKILLSKTG